ncbi:hypothetical protein BDZ89DRAFT_297756 [Hymenopellis radicata]|nr:hypothetical protein BDZ89DRAFT_297756 [Hymenopellis radicata]
MLGFTQGLLLLSSWFWLPVRAASISNVVCSSSFDWSINACNQTPCEVAAYALQPCTGEVSSVNALSDNMQYTGPATERDANPCECNTVVYALFSACAACQGKNYVSWSAWNAQCPEAFISSLPSEIPENTSIPQWAYLNYAEGDTFDAAKAQEWASKHLPDYYPTSTTTTTSTHTKSSSTSFSSSSSSVQSTTSWTHSSSSEPSTMATTSLVPTSDGTPDIDNLSAARNRKLSTAAWAIIGIVVSFAIIVGAVLAIRVWRHWRLNASYKILSMQYQSVPTHSRNNSTDPPPPILLARPASRSETLSSIGYHNIVYTPSAHDSSIFPAAESSNVLTEQNHHHVPEPDSDGRGQWRYKPQETLKRA